jgi:hypothetical protein
MNDEIEIESEDPLYDIPAKVKPIALNKENLDVTTFGVKLK